MEMLLSAGHRVTVSRAVQQAQRRLQICQEHALQHLASFVVTEHATGPHASMQKQL